MKRQRGETWVEGHKKDRGKEIEGKTEKKRQRGEMEGKRQREVYRHKNTNSALFVFPSHGLLGGANPDPG